MMMVWLVIAGSVEDGIAGRMGIEGPGETLQ